jgi:uncharacterized protein YdeI (YjbR/CyaY-like superfamily)
MDTIPSSCFFENREAWRNWLIVNHDSVKELWVIYLKKHTGKQSIIYREALEEAICFGWIDGIIKRIDEERYMQRFTPRREKSNWSPTNIKLALKLSSEGKMHESGLHFRDYWVDDLGTKPLLTTDPLVPVEFETALENSPLATNCFRNLTPSHKKNYLLWIMAAKRQDTREKRITEAIALLENGKKLGLK